LLETDLNCFVDDDKDDNRTSILQDRLAIMKELNQEREKLIQTGQMTPFGGFVSVASTSEVDDKEQCYDDDNDEDYCADMNAVNQLPMEVDSDEYVPDEEELHDSWYDKDTHKAGRANLKTLTSSSLKHKHKQPSLNVQYTEEDAVEIKTKKGKRKATDRFKTKALDDGDDHLFRKRIR
jgi:hypothetical protein